MNALIKRYKIIATIIALNEFTAADLSIISGVETEHTALVLRELNKNKSVGKIPAQGPGGRKSFYCIIPAQRQSLQTELNALFKKITHNSKVSNRAVEPPLSLLIAEDILSRRVPRNKEIDQKRELLELAHLNIETARAEMGSELFGDRSTAHLSDSITHNNLVKRFQSVVSRYAKMEISLNKTRQNNPFIYPVPAKSKLIKQVFDFQKSGFCYWHGVMSILQDQAALTLNTMLSQTSWIPDEGREVMLNRVSACKKESDRYGSYVEESFSGIERNFFNRQRHF
jgi:hypothetical protein